MASLRADRRLYETPEKDAIVEEGDVRGRWLLVGIGSTISAGDVKKYRLSMKDGRIRYKGSPKFPRLPKVKEASKPEDKAVTEHEDKRIRFGGKAEEEITGTLKGSDLVEADADDSEEEEITGTINVLEVVLPPEWPGRTSPEAYLKQYPTGPKAELAKAVIAARDEGADGGS